MQVRFTKHKLYVTGRPVDDADNERIKATMEKNGADLGDAEPYYQDDAFGFMDDLESLGIIYPFTFDDFFKDGPQVVDVDEWTFRHLCGYQSD